MTYTTNEILLKVQNVNKAFDVPVLRDINFEIRNIMRPDMTQGQIISLVGKSGSGKSTLFNILAGLLAPDSGKIDLCTGIRTAEVPDGVMAPVNEGDMGVVFQNSYLYEWRKVKALLDGPARRNKKLDVQQLFEKLDITKLMDKFTSQLSGGQRQRVAIAEQLLNGSDFILLDEPFSGLDTLSIDKVTNILTDVAASDDRKTIILISHDLSNSLAISDKAFILAREEGKDGATITQEVCLAEQGLAWQPSIKEDMRFRDLLKFVKSLL